MKTALIAAAAATLALGAAADEVWSTEFGDIVYERDSEDGAAVLSYPAAEPGQRGLAFVDGLAGEYQGRTSYSGVWIEPDGDRPGACAYAISDPETGETSRTWGRIIVTFVDPDFPATFVAQRGACFEDPDEYLVARPVVAAPAPVE